MNKLHIALAILCAGALCGCVPEAVSTTNADTMTRIFACDGEMVSIYHIGADQKALLKDEFEAWKQAGFEGFDESFVVRAPTLLISGTTTNGVSYKIDFGTEYVTVNEVQGKMVDGAQYARDLTDADKRFRQFLLDCIEAGKLPQLARGKMPKSDE